MAEYVICYGYAVNSDKLPMVLKNKPPKLAGCLNLPGGKIENGETIVEAAVRELYEETGLEELQTYDDSIYYPSEHYGTIECDEYLVHCVKIPVVYQELKPKSNETEQFAWHSCKEVLSNSLLMPNLRLIIPMVLSGCKNWTIYDKGDNWRTSKQHEIELSLSGCRTISVTVTGMAAFKRGPNEH